MLTKEVDKIIFEEAVFCCGLDERQQSCEKTDLKDYTLMKVHYQKYQKLHPPSSK